MANVQKSGFRYIGNMSGGLGATPMTFTRPVASGYNGANSGIYVGDAIISVSDGTVAIAATGSRLLGVVSGLSYVTAGKRVFGPYLPDSTTFTPSTVGSVNESLVTFIPAIPGMLFETDGDDGTTVTTIAGAKGLVQNNCNTAIVDGDTTTGASGMCLDISTAATTATLSWRIVNVVVASDNDPSGTRFKYIVTPNLSEWTNEAATGVTGV